MDGIGLDRMEQARIGVGMRGRDVVSLTPRKLRLSSSCCSASFCSCEALKAKRNSSIFASKVFEEETVSLSDFTTVFTACSK